MNRFGVPVAFLVVMVIWSTTPLAIQWSSGDAPLTSALLRMLLGCTFCGLILFATKSRLSFNRENLKIFLVGGLSIFGAMSLIYLAAQSMPSGWIAVLYGLSPLFTGVFAAFVEPESQLDFFRVLGILLGIFGLYFVFQASLSIDQNTFVGVVLVVAAVIVSSSSAVVIRQFGNKTELSGMQITTGGLLIAIPMFIASAFLFEPVSTVGYSNKEMWSIAYLGLIGTGIGFSLYFYLLRHISASKVSLVTLVTPITALLIGNWFNDEEIVRNVWIGGACVCTGLLMYQYKPRLGWRKL
ncbi:MAG: DMT family transporter [Pseudomonadota bacterium]